MRQDLVHNCGLARAQKPGNQQDRDGHARQAPVATGRRTGRPGRAATSITPSMIKG
jgi:hypothetical protein